MDTINQVAELFWQSTPGVVVYAFRGQMGSGKTTFIHALCDVKGIKDVVGSPTFSIINEYIYYEKGTLKKIFHIDLYRLKDEQEALLAGVEDCLYSDHISMVEWPEKAPNILPDNSLYVQIEVVDDKTRKLKVG
jgi:tRNA threonylcarbamoyladenosine biosynthesis protein TsaE